MPDTASHRPRRGERQQLDLSLQNADLVRLVSDAFELASESLDRRGAGLGLSIVEGLVRAHRGQVGVDRLTGDRIRFWFVLPQ